MSVAQFDERRPVVAGVKILPADGTGVKDLYTGVGSGSRLDDILISNSDAIAHVVGFSITVGGTAYRIGSVSVPAGSGYAGAAPVSLGATCLPTLQLGWLLPPGDVLQVFLSVAMQAGTELYVIAFGGDL